MKRGTAFFVHLFACHFSTIQTTGNLNLDTFSTHTHGRSDSLLNGTTISNLTFELTSNLRTYDDCIQLRTLHLVDVDLNILLDDFLKFLFQFVNFLSTLTDNETGASSADSNSYKFKSTFNNDTGDTSVGKTGIQILSDFAIFEDSVTVVFTTIPVGIPTANNAEAVTNWINFLSHLD